MTSSAGSSVSEAATAAATTNTPPSAMVCRNGARTRNNARNPTATVAPENITECPAVRAAAPAACSGVSPRRVSSR